MKALNHSFAIVIGLSLLATPVLALNDDTASFSFVAMKDVLSQGSQVPLTPFSDDHLASIEGEGICIACPSIRVGVGVSPITQFNLTNQATFAVGRNISQEVGSESLNGTRMNGTRNGTRLSRSPR